MKRFIAVLFLLTLTTALFAKPPINYEGIDGSLKSYDMSKPKKSPFLSGSAPTDSRNFKVSSSGTKYIPVVLVDFPDRGFKAEHDKDYYKKMLQTDTANLTMTGYYDIMSNGTLNLEFEIFGPYTMPEEIDYYGANEDGGTDTNIGYLVKETVDDMVTEKGAAYFNKFDSDGTDGVDVLLIFFAGYGEETSGNENEIWAHQWDLKNALASIKEPISGTTYHNFNEYTIQSENTPKNDESTIGTACHEFGHVLGLPDTYDVDYETWGVGNWSIMGSGVYGSHRMECDPAPFLAVERYKLGWLTPVLLEPTSTPQTVTFRSDIEDPLYEAYRIDLTDNGSQYLILEGKKRKADNTGMYVPESGLLITQIFEGRYVMLPSMNRVNAGSDKIHGVDVLEACSGVYEPAFDYTGSWGSLWKKTPNSQMLFRETTRTGIGPSSLVYVFAGSLMLMAVSLFRRKGRIQSLFLTVAAAAMLFASCSLSGGRSVNTFVANTNYYTSYSLESKTGISGVVIDNITFDEESGIGSFTYYLDFSSGK